MFLFPPIHFLKFLVKSQPQRSYKKGSYKKKECISPEGNSPLVEMSVSFSETE